ncbi:MAG: hypothetical protein EXR88_04065 [Gammaproteobacteria bacterium]|nr:hypothetical protein [Gammaproteobacteria bacterium]
MIINSPEWLAKCSAAGVDPLVIEHTARNFMAYYAYQTRNRTACLSLRDWFRFYSQENSAELSAETLKVEGCSVDERSVRPPSADYKAAIFYLLEIFVVETKIISLDSHDALT